MRVYDFFKTIYEDKERRAQFILAYVADDCESYRFPKEAKDRVTYILESKNFINKALETLISFVPIESKNVACVFKAYDDLEEFSDKYYYSSSLIEYDEMIKVNPEEVVIYNFGNENNIQTYCYMFDDIPEILGYQMSETSIEHYGWLNCALAIFHEISFNGIREETREERKNELEESTKYYEENKDNPDAFISGDDMIKQLHDMIYEDMDEDAAAYHQIKEKYENMAEKELKPYRMKYFEKCNKQYIEDNLPIIKKEVKKVH